MDLPLVLSVTDCCVQSSSFIIVLYEATICVLISVDARHLQISVNNKVCMFLMFVPFSF